MFPINDAFDAVLVGGFLFGLMFTVGSAVLGFADFGLGHDADFGHDIGHDIGHDVGHGHDVDGGHGFAGLFNLSALLAFITWFSGITYLARNGFGLPVFVAIMIGLILGLAAGAVITWFLVKVLRKNSQDLDPRDWDQIGIIGRVSSAIRPGGFGEIVYEQNGIRQVASARTEGDELLPRSTEVVIMRIERGVAIVQPWDALIAEHDASRGRSLS